MDHIINYLKWPVAIVAVLLFMPLLNANIELIGKTFSDETLFKFLLPMGVVLVFWFAVPGLAGSYFSIFEHEFSHMLLAILTFHIPKGMVIEENRGGSFSFSGKGNWLITVAPYFVPSFPLLVMLSALFWQWKNIPLPELFIPILGVMFGYHLASNIAQIHPGQTDFEKAGWLFSLLFLPSANLFAFGMVWCFAKDNWNGVASWCRFIVDQTLAFYHQFI